MLPELIALSGIVAAVVGVIASLRGIAAQRSGEDLLAERLIHRKDFRRRLYRYLEAHPDIEKLSDREIAELMAYVESELAALEGKQERRIREALDQPSVYGRRNYARKLIRQSTRRLQHAN
jgi:uncharacterized protein with ACT and thioredoxin-like domain